MDRVGADTAKYLEGVDLVVAAPDMTNVVKVRNRDTATTDIVGRSYNKKNSTDESVKTHCTTDCESLHLDCEASPASDVIMG